MQRNDGGQLQENCFRNNAEERRKTVQKNCFRNECRGTTEDSTYWRIAFEMNAKEGRGQLQMIAFETNAEERRRRVTGE
jgi:hypothetical protein